MPDSTTDAPPDLIASTGVNDPNSPWNDLLQGAFKSGIQIGTGAVDKALGIQTPLATSNGAPTAAAAAPGLASSKDGFWLLVGISVLGAIVILYTVLGGRK